jgi:tRNA pseudouridine38-40 synthase
LRLGSVQDPGPFSFWHDMTLFDPILEPVGDAVAVTRVRLLVAYDGVPFHGFAENVGVRTVAGVLRAAVERVLGHQIQLSVAGRTDRGVHAWGQVVSFDAATATLDLEHLLRACNKLCRPSIVVREAHIAPPGFDARFSARSRVYRYRLLNTRLRNPMLVSATWHVAETIDLNAMRLAGDALLGEHDFSSFCRKPRPVPGSRAADGVDGVPSLVRRVRRVEWRRLDEGILELEIEANAFCQQMVRAITGTLVDVGTGRLRAGQIGDILAARDRNTAGQVAPPEGLTLWHVRY